MRPVIRRTLNTDILEERDISKSLPDSYGLKVSYANATQIFFTEGSVIVQNFSNYLLHLEVYDFDLQTNLDASFIVEQPTFFIFGLLNGTIGFSSSKGEKLTEVNAGFFYATYNLPDQYNVNQLSAGRHSFFYISPKTEWLASKAKDLPSMEKFIGDFVRGARTIGYMPRCIIDAKTRKILVNLFNPRKIKDEDVDIQVLYRTMQLLKRYDLLIFSGSYIYLDHQKEQIRAIQRYLNDNSTSIQSGDIQKIADQFYFSRRTLIRLFKNETGYSIKQYIEKCRMEFAAKLLSDDNYTISSIAKMCGYKDESYFSKVFREYFGQSPLKVRNR